MRAAGLLVGMLPTREVDDAFDRASVAAMAADPFASAPRDELGRPVQPTGACAVVWAMRGLDKVD